MQVLGPGRVDDIERLVEIGEPDLQVFGFDITALEKAARVLLDEADKLLPRFPYIKDIP
jgi:hypothetical protein